jgi:serine/threonine protein phosphatase PrpC
MQGFRNEMEDDHNVEALPHHPGHLLFGVYDGHGGDTASRYIAERLPTMLDSSPTPTDPTVIVDTLLKLDKEFMETQSTHEHGSTVVFALTGPAKQGRVPVTVAHLGDSRCLWIDSYGALRFATEDHKPNGQVERARIVAAGGTVSMNRVNGNLAVARAIGDSSYKDVVGVAHEDQPVSAKAEVSVLSVPTSDFLLLACDGYVVNVMWLWIARHEPRQ